jgi:AraC-like DNA-binding protein
MADDDGCSLPINGKKDVSWRFYKNQNFIGYSPEWCDTAQIPAELPLQSLGIWIDPQLFDSLVIEQKDRFPIGLQDTINKHRKISYFQEFSVPPAVDMAIYQVLNCPFTWPSNKLYLESKVLEIISYTLAQLINLNTKSKHAFKFKSGDVERVHHARDLISQDIQNPPKLKELAKRVGLPHPKLNSCFRTLYGTTVYGYIREMRLNRAKLLLNQGNMNVTEVALEVGYSSLSHFARAFKDCFGTLPGYYLREKWSRHSDFSTEEHITQIYSLH